MGMKDLLCSIGQRHGCDRNWFVGAKTIKPAKIGMCSLNPTLCVTTMWHKNKICRQKKNFEQIFLRDEDAMRTALILTWSFLLLDDATNARYWMTFLVFSVFPAPDSPLGTEKNTDKKSARQCYFLSVVLSSSECQIKLTCTIWTDPLDLNINSDRNL